MKRNYSNFDVYLDRLLPDIYPQPPDKGHLRWANQVFKRWVVSLEHVHSVLDAGCGDTMFMKPKFEGMGWKYTGVALGGDHPDIIKMDFSFLDYPDNSFDLVWARHVLEHSPFPILTLMEWERVSARYLILVLPRPTTDLSHVGRNHYSVTNKEQLKFWLDLSGWKVLQEDDFEVAEIRLLCCKKVMP